MWHQPHNHYEDPVSPKVDVAPKCTHSEGSDIKVLKSIILRSGKSQVEYGYELLINRVHVIYNRFFVPLHVKK